MMQGWLRWLARACCVLAGIHVAAAPAEARRVALVIGNAEYRIGRLANPGNDAGAVAEAFERQLRFDKVILRRNLGLDGFRAALKEMAGEAHGAEYGVIYFAGHGIEVAGRNYLIPVDATLAAARDIELEAVALDTVLGQLDGVLRLKLVILDACRNNPFAVTGARRSVTRGLVRIEPEGSTLVAYAAKDGTTADDGKGPHSPFTGSLLKRIATPGLDVRRLFGYVSDDVLAATNRTQEPYLYGRLGGAEIFLSPQSAPPGAQPPPPPPGPQPLPAGDVAQAWAMAKDSTSIAALEAFRRQYGSRDAFYDQLAKDRIEALRRQQLALAKEQEERRRAEERRAEADRLRPGRVFRDCPDVCPEMVVVPAGSFTMGSPSPKDAHLEAKQGPQRRVAIPRPFAAGRFEVTFAEWDACVAAGGCSHNPKDEGKGRGQHPVFDVSWNDVTQQYLPWLSQRTGKTYRLLTEAEWEYAARAGTTTHNAFGTSISKTQAQFGVQGTAPVGSFRPNGFGLYDMHGNVWEWVQDCFNATYDRAPSDGSAWMAGDCNRRVMRGGAYYFDPYSLSSAVRYAYDTPSRTGIVGFRVARAL